MKLIQLPIVVPNNSGLVAAINVDKIETIMNDAKLNCCVIQMASNTLASTLVPYRTILKMVQMAREDVVITEGWIKEHTFTNSYGEVCSVSPIDFDEFHVPSEGKEIRLHWYGKPSTCHTYVPYDEGFINHLTAIGMKQV